MQAGKDVLSSRGKVAGKDTVGRKRKIDTRKKRRQRQYVCGRDCNDEKTVEVEISSFLGASAEAMGGEKKKGGGLRCTRCQAKHRRNPDGCAKGHDRT